MSNYKDTMAYKLYKRAEENLESGKADEELLERVLKQVFNSVDYGQTMVRANIEPAYIQTVARVTDVLKGMGFKVMSIDEKEIVIIWDYSEEDVKEENKNGNEN